MESLKPSQLILLSILVTFITTIATTIITISLLSDTPLSITQVVNQVVERERLTDANVEELRTELLAQVEARLDEEEPQVLGVETVRSPDFLEIMSALPDWNESDQILLASGIHLSASSTPAKGEQSLAAYGAYLLYEESPVFAFGEVSLGEELFGLSIIEQVVRPGTADVFFVENDSEELYSFRAVDTAACFEVGEWVTSATGEIVGVCTQEGKALVGVSNYEIEQDESEIQEAP